MTRFEIFDLDAYLVSDFYEDFNSDFDFDSDLGKDFIWYKCWFWGRFGFDDDLYLNFPVIELLFEKINANQLITPYAINYLS